MRARTPAAAVALATLVGAVLLSAGCQAAMYHTFEEATDFRPFHGFFQSERTANWLFNLQRTGQYKVGGTTALGVRLYELANTEPVSPTEATVEVTCEDSVVYRVELTHIAEDTILATFPDGTPYDSTRLSRIEVNKEHSEILRAEAGGVSRCSGG